MSNGRDELFIFMGAAFASLVGLFVLHTWYGTYIDVRFNDHLAANGPAEGMVAAREADQRALSSGKVPIERAMQELAERGRGAFSSVAPTASQDLSALSGWIRSPNFKPVTAHPVRSARAPEPAPAGAPTAAAPAAPEVAPTPAPAPPAVKPAKPGRKGSHAPR
ncbi:MAG TPA: hypothetical protein VGI70_18475 [Polyangiales bacterium]